MREQERTSDLVKSRRGETVDNVEQERKCKNRKIPAPRRTAGQGPSLLQGTKKGKNEQTGRYQN